MKNKRPSLEVIVATMNQKKIEPLLEKMNIQTDAIIANQNDQFSKCEIKHNGKKIKVFNFDEKGVGLNRNNGLMRTNADIVLFADDDIKYVDNYEQIIINEFAKLKDADVIVFNVTQNEEGKRRYQIKKNKRVRKFNCLRYGAVRIAVNVEKIREKNICFSLLFGGGAKYGSGEDSIFIHDCVKSGLKVYSSPLEILTILESTSTWFDGYNEKFFFDKGALIKAIYGKLGLIYTPLYLLKHRNFYNEIGRKKALTKMLEGYKEME